LETLLESLVLQAANNSFRFVLCSTAEIAVPADPRAQIFRAAVALDRAAVHDMLHHQVMTSVQCSINSLSMDARCLTLDPGSAALIKLQEMFTESLDNLKMSANEVDT